MKAAIIREPGTLIVDKIPDPKLGPYDALCRQLYGATCVGTDLHIINNQFPWPVKYPTLLGHESVGRVERIGAKVRNLRVGDVVARVCNLNIESENLTSTWGGFAEYGIARDHRAMKEDGLPASDWNAYRVNEVIPPDIDPAAATMMITWRETLSFIRRMGLSPGKTVLIVGSGGNGLAFAAHARNLGATAVALIGSSERKVVAAAVGATHYYAYRGDSGTQTIKQDFPAGFDFIIDAIGKASSLADMLPHAAAGATVAHYGLDDFGKWTLNPSRARGSFTYYNAGYDEAETHEAVIAFMRDGKLNARHWLNSAAPYPLERIADAYAAVQSRKEIKALVKLSS
jgi:D-arabinose 1-dehydrogenase-like Zn-dependent alcohol dehydrogenase